jgi:hypothetical protein
MSTDDIRDPEEDELQEGDEVEIVEGDDPSDPFPEPWRALLGQHGVIHSISEFADDPNVIVLFGDGSDPTFPGCTIRRAHVRKVAASPEPIE